MRYFVFLLALAGAGLSGFIGHRWYVEQNDGAIKIGAQRAKKEEGNLKTKKLVSELTVEEQVREAQLGKMLAAYNGRAKSHQWVLLAAGAGLLGAILVLLRWGTMAALLLAAMPLVAGYFYFPALVPTGGALLASVLAVFVRPRRRKIVDEQEEATTGNDANHDHAARHVRVDVAHKKPVAPMVMITRFCCEFCDVVLRTAHPVPVGKKIRCPHCGDVTPIHKMPSMPLKSNVKKMARAKRRANAASANGKKKLAG